MALLSNYIAAAGGSNIQFACIALSGASGGNSFTWPANTFFKVPFNAVFDNTDNICTLNTSLSTFTLPAGLYNLQLTQRATDTVGGTNPRANATRIRINDTTTVTKWPSQKNHDQNNTNLEVAGNQIYSPAGVYLASQSTVSVEQFWEIDSLAWESELADGESNIYYRLDIWKLR